MSVKPEQYTDPRTGKTKLRMPNPELAEMIRYRKTKTGEWVAFGAADKITAGAQIQVTKTDGTTVTETVARTGKTFQVDGYTMVYGYLDRTGVRSNPGPAGQRETRCTGRMDCQCDACE